MATVINNRSSLVTDPIRNFRFLVTITPHENDETKRGWKVNPAIGFTSVSGLAVTTDSIPYREGGYNTTVHQIPGQTQFSPVTFQRGVLLNSRQHWDWMRTLFKTVTGNAVKEQNVSFRADIEIAVLSHPIAGGAANTAGAEATSAQDDHVSVRFKLYNAWVTSLQYSDLNAGDNAILVEQMTVVHEGLDATWATGLDAANSAAAFTY